MTKTTSNVPPESDAARSGLASGHKIGLHQPSDDNRTQDRLANVDLASRGAKVGDHLRDKRGKGVAGEYDDSIGHDADRQYVSDDAAQRPKP